MIFFNDSLIGNDWLDAGFKGRSRFHIKHRIVKIEKSKDKTSLIVIIHVLYLREF